MTKSIMIAESATGECPPSLTFTLDYADASEMTLIRSFMVENHRQTMNLRTMPTARLLVLKSTQPNVIIGWAGIDYQHKSEFPEIFSQYIVPQYRTFLLGLILIHSRALVLKQNGFITGYFRMESEKNADLLEVRKNSKLYQVISDGEINPTWKAMCGKCELFGKECRRQSYLRFNVEDGGAFGNKRLGLSESPAFPKKVILEPVQFRQNARQLQARWAA